MLESYERLGSHDEEVAKISKVDNSIEFFYSDFELFEKNKNEECYLKVLGWKFETLLPKVVTNTNNVKVNVEK